MISNFISYKSLGFSIDEYTLKYALISKTKNNFTVEKEEKFSLDCKTALQSFIELSQKVPTACSFPSYLGLLRTEKLPQKKRAHATLILKNKVESTLLSDQVLLKDWKSQKKTLSYYAIKEKTVHKFNEKCKNLGLVCDHLHPQSFAYASLLAINNTGLEPKMYLCFNEWGCEVIILKKKVLLECFYLQSCTSLFIEKLHQRLHLLESKYKLPSSKVEVLNDSGASFAILDSITAKSDFHFERTQFPKFLLHKEYLGEIGSALILMETRQCFPSFMPQNKTYPLLKKKYKHHLLSSLLLILLTLGVQAALWTQRIGEQKKANQLLYSQIIGQIKKKPLKPSENLPTKLENKKALTSINKILLSRIQKTPPYPLKPNTLLVTEVLMWFKSMYDQLPTDHYSNPIKLNSLEYKLVSYPIYKKKKAPYLVRVSLSFKASSPEIARGFHQLLLKDKEVIQSQKKVTWTFQNNLYHASFYLKTYPNSVSIDS